VSKTIIENGTIGERLGPREIFVETWAADYGSPNQIDENNDSNGAAALIPEEGFSFVSPPQGPDLSVAFVDGVRRGEAPLAQWIDEVTVPGLAGAYAVGAVLADAGRTPSYGHERVERVVVWAGGQTGELPEIAGGWRWRVESTPDPAPIAPMRRLQELMRRAEARLADALAQEGYLVLLDGTLWFASPYDHKNIAGYVKTHHVRLLPEAEAKRLPDLPAGHRTTIFRTDANRYACYLRLAERAPRTAPMSGIVRLEFAGSLPLETVRTMAGGFAAAIPRYAGIAHIDPRAPQNLQPIGALETHLRHLMGDGGLAERAVRDAVAMLTN
jgi:hypothetical protein